MGLNFLFKNVCDYDSLYLFLDSFIVAHDLLKLSSYLGFMLIDKTWHDGLDEDAIIIESIRLFEDYIMVETNISQMEFFKETFVCVESDMSSNNEIYAISCYIEKERRYFIQFILGFR